MSSLTRIALYLRLSKEDEEADESNSIHMQRVLLQTYVEKHFSHYQITEFKDDGYSGTNFKRPEITELLELVKLAEIDCIIVKDFSRFSRDYIELGSYIEQIFPFMNVRFIAVNDNYDSAEMPGTTEALDMSFKHLLYDLYSKDLSVKVRASLTSMKESGIYVSGLCPLGYEKDPQDRHQLRVVKDEAEIVKRIYAMTLEGWTSTQIARYLNQEGVKTPIEYKMKAGKKGRVPKGDKFQWSTSGICQILRNEFYTGDVVYSKYKRKQVGGMNHIKPRNEWKVHHDHHEAIISREDFALVQATRGGNSAKPGRKTVKNKHPLIGKAVCDCCQRNLTYRDTALSPYFYCGKRYENANTQCVRKIDAMLLEEAVLFLFHQEMSRLPGLEQLQATQKEQLSRQKRDTTRKIKHLETELLQLQRAKAEKYEAYTIHGSLTVYQKAVAAINDQERQIKENIQACAHNSLNRLSHPLLPYLDMRKITKESADALIKKIVVSREGQIVIEWIFNIAGISSSVT